ncbi:ferredoxin-thioredoxin reductase catalytic domain-containing protein [Methanobrevibacter filiformis]|uniref:ferredoxin:thioredoxin reductase n=1 Tax=Methanobrevibacter filiformis TaxID=55758 RepID=A0A166AI62_9EURY|nr:ferredoxin-thioredoxin reductase catalytic domain-containing protein [Methanobrevibacter filiformis]KZX12063.1 ferredoxin thioredoxin reductase catalytic beta chain [Methanobrevibacter filiformis]
MSNPNSYEKFKEDSEKTGYNVNTDKEFVEALLKSIEVNKERYGYGACPCRLASGKKEKDLDLICPCDYRDSDLNDYGACFCALYVTEDVLNGKKELKSIPDRRLKTLKAKSKESSSQNLNLGKLKVPIWRCKVCGYLCGKEKPPVKCPICKAESDRFEQIL